MEKLKAANTATIAAGRFRVDAPDSSDMCESFWVVLE